MTCVLRLTGSDEVHTLSPATVASSEVLTHIVCARERDDDDGGEDDVDPIAISREYATARSLATVVGFMERAGRRRGEPDVAAVRLPKPLWNNHDDAAAVATLPGLAQEERSLMRALDGDVTLLVDVTRTADFLQVDGLLEVCCALLAAGVGRGAVASAALGVGVLSPPVMVRMLTYMPTSAQRQALEQHEALRNEVCFFAVVRWLADLRIATDSRSLDDEVIVVRPLQLAYCASLFDTPMERRVHDDAAVMAEAGHYMVEHGFVPSGLDAAFLCEKLQGLLSVARSASVFFSKAVVGPLGSWLKVALTHFSMSEWLVVSDARAALIPHLNRAEEVFEGILVALPSVLAPSQPDLLTKEARCDPRAEASRPVQQQHQNFRRVAFPVSANSFLVVGSNGTWTTQRLRGYRAPFYRMFVSSRLGFVDFSDSL